MNKELQAIFIKDLNKNYGKTEVLKNINLSINEGEFYCMMGPNGSGKTTLAAILASIKKQSSGLVKIYDNTPEKSRALIGYMPQENFISAYLTGRENLAYFAGLMGFKGNDLKIIVSELLKKVGLEKDADKLVSKYSGGMKKRLELATILFNGIKVLILDEPTTGLDPSARRDFFNLIKDNAKNDTTIFLITHIGTDAELADRIGLINKGEIIAEGTPEELKRKYNLKNVLTIETVYKDKKIKDILSSIANSGDVFETDLGYKMYSDDITKDIPFIIKKLEQEGFSVNRLESTTSTLDDVFYKITGRLI